MNILRAADTEEDMRWIAEMIHDRVDGDDGGGVFNDDFVESRKQIFEAALVALFKHYEDPDHDDFIELAEKDEIIAISWIQDQDVNIEGYDGSANYRWDHLDYYVDFFEETASDEGDTIVKVNLANLGSKIKESTTARGLDNYIINHLKIDASDWGYLSGREPQSIKRNLRR